jgi:hypothetical protein
MWNESHCIPSLFYYLGWVEVFSSWSASSTSTYYAWRDTRREFFNYNNYLFKTSFKLIQTRQPPTFGRKSIVQHQIHFSNLRQWSHSSTTHFYISNIQEFKRWWNGKTRFSGNTFKNFPFRIFNTKKNFRSREESIKIDWEVKIVEVQSAEAVLHRLRPLLDSWPIGVGIRLPQAWQLKSKSLLID